MIHRANKEAVASQLRDLGQLVKQRREEIAEANARIDEILKGGSEKFEKVDTRQGEKKWSEPDLLLP